MAQGRAAHEVNAALPVAACGTTGPALPAGPPVAAPVAAPAASLRFALVGFDIGERLLVEAAVERSQRQSSPLQQLEPRDSAQADVVVIDARDSCALAWARRQPGLALQAAVWVDAAAAPPGHLLASRPAPWATLPVLLAQALRQRAAMHLAPAMAPPPGPPPCAAAPVLVVEHCAAARAELVALMQRRGVAAVAAPDMQSAIDAIAATRFAWVLLGSASALPGLGLASLRACQRLKAAAPALPVVMLGRRANASDRARAQAAGAAALLALPLDADRLYHAIDATAAAAPSTYIAIRAACAGR